MTRSLVLLDTTYHGRGTQPAVRARSCSIASIPIALVLLVLQERRLESRSLSFLIFRKIGCVLIKIRPPAKSETYRRSHLRQRAGLPLEIAAREEHTPPLCFALFSCLGDDGVAIHAAASRRARPGEALDRFLAEPRCNRDVIEPTGLRAR